MLAFDKLGLLEKRCLMDLILLKLPRVLSALGQLEMM
jgi:hypothetical protein